MIHIGDVMEVLPQMAAAGVRVQMVVTSPPYWGLRSYLPMEHADKPRELGLEALHDCLGWATGNRCGECHICRMVEVFRLVRDVLAPDGTCFVNYGDSYAAGGSGDIGTNSTLIGSQRSQRASRMLWGDKTRVPPAGLKPKDLCAIPWRFALAMQADGWWLRQDIIWHKPNPMPESVRDRCTKAHEYLFLFLFSKSERYFWDHEAFLEPVSGGSHARGPGNVTSAKGAQAYLDGDERHRTKAGLLGYAEKQRMKMPDGWDSSVGVGAHGAFHKNGREKGAVRVVGVGPKARPRKGAPNEPQPKYNADFAAACVGLVERRNRRSVWTIASEAFSDAHFATFPRALVAPCILAGSRVGDVVLDPFMGSGTTAEVAESLGRRWLGVELNADYARMQAARTAQRGLAL